jgi:hypothetical protein
VNWFGCFVAKRRAASRIWNQSGRLKRFPVYFPEAVLSTL